MVRKNTCQILIQLNLKAKQIVRDGQHKKCEEYRKELIAESGCVVFTIYLDYVFY